MNFNKKAMKKTIFTVILGILFLGANAQDLEIVHPVTSTQGSVDSVLYIKMHIKNKSANATSVYLERSIKSLTVGQLSYFCFGITCYPPNVNVSPENISLSGGAEDSSVKTYLDPRGVEGTSVVNYCFYNVDKTDSACLLLTYGAMATGIVNNSHLKFIKVFPNPATETLKLAFNTEKNYNSSEIQIADLSGRVVYTENVDTKDGLIAINIDALPAGVYICNLVADGVTIARDKVVVN